MYITQTVCKLCVAEEDHELLILLFHLLSTGTTGTSHHVMQGGVQCTSMVGKILSYIPHPFLPFLTILLFMAFSFTSETL